VQAFDPILHQPCTDRANNSKNSDQKKAQQGIAHNSAAQRNTAEHTDSGAENPEALGITGGTLVQVLVIGRFIGYFPAEAGIVITGTVNVTALSKKVAEDAHLFGIRSLPISIRL